MLTTGATMVGMWMQDPGQLSSGNSRLLMFFVAMVAVAMVVQAIAVVVFAIGALKSQRRLAALAEDFRTKVMPVINSAETIFHDAAPKIRVLTDNLVETSHIVRAKAQEFDATLTDVNLKTRAQVYRVDNMVSTTLAKTSSIAEAIHDGIRTPVKQIAGLIAGLRAGMDVLVNKARDFNGYRPPEL